MADTPSKSDVAEFRAFCWQATLEQLRNVIAKERDAGRRAYQFIAEEILRERNAKREG